MATITTIVPIVLLSDSGVPAGEVVLLAARSLFSCSNRRRCASSWRSRSVNMTSLGRGAPNFGDGAEILRPPTAPALKAVTFPYAPDTS